MHIIQRIGSRNLGSFLPGLIPKKAESAGKMKYNKIIKYITMKVLIKDTV